MARQPLEDREYQVHPGQARWAMSNLSAAGLPITNNYMAPSGVYVIIVQQPAGSPDVDWRNVQQQRRRNDDPLRRLTIALGVLVLAGAALYLAWTVATGAGWRPPWQAMPNGEPVVTQTDPGWTLPNPLQGAQDAAQATQDAADAVSDAVAMLVRVVLVLVALAGLWLLRGLLGPLARGAAQLAQDVAGRMRR